MLDPPGGALEELAKVFAHECEVTRVHDQAALLADLADEPPDLVVLDFALGDGVHGGSEILAAVRAVDGDVPVVVVAQEGGIDIASRVIAAGATDFLVRSHRLEERVATQLRKISGWVRLIDRNRALVRENRVLRAAGMVGDSPEIRAVMQQVRRVAKVPRPVLVLGERGVGKELVARAIHEASEREGPLVIVNCAAVPKNLLEAELFGHERGAFTGAERRTEGKFEAARGGTLFLDEIGHMELGFQTKILRAVEYGTFLRVGGAKEVRSDARIVAATNADLRAMMVAGTFLPDLHDRLAFEEIRVPPLRDRRDDIEVLAEYFMQRFMREVPSFRGKRLSQEARDALRRHPFPGNVRELKNMIERAVYREVGEEVTPEDLGLDARPASSPSRGTFKERVARFERGMIEGALEEAGGNQAEAARRLGLTYDQLRHYRRKHLG
jgi:DNA-binding NtrC family response regulator